MREHFILRGQLPFDSSVRIVLHFAIIYLVRMSENTFLPCDFCHCFPSVSWSFLILKDNTATSKRKLSVSENFVQTRYKSFHYLKRNENYSDSNLFQIYITNYILNRSMPAV